MSPKRRSILMLALAIVAWGCDYSLAQTAQQPSQSNPQGRATTQQSVVVEAQLTPEEKEEGELNDVNQPIYKLEEQHNCEEAVDKYRTFVIPMAEKAVFKVPKNKFLFLAYRGIGDCDLAVKNYLEAEEMFQKLLEYASVWPGTDDSAYPINYRSIGLARMGQQRWKDAEEPLQKAVSIFDEQIDRAAKSKLDFERNEMANNYRMSQDEALDLLAVVYAREQRFADGLSLLERAYNQAITFHAPASIVKQIVDNGRAIAVGTGDDVATATWSQRSVTSN